MAAEEVFAPSANVPSLAKSSPAWDCPEANCRIWFLNSAASSGGSCRVSASFIASSATAARRLPWTASALSPVWGDMWDDRTPEPVSVSLPCPCSPSVRSRRVFVRASSAATIPFPASDAIPSDIVCPFSPASMFSPLSTKPSFPVSPAWPGFPARETTSWYNFTAPGTSPRASMESNTSGSAPRISFMPSTNW